MKKTKKVTGFNTFKLVALCVGLVIMFQCNQTKEQNRLKEEKLPNIVFILADDLGYGDIQSYNPQSRIPTPNLNKLAEMGMRFTDAHSPSTVCTPSRYSLLTGNMAFRNGMKGVFTGAGGPCLIKEDQLTLPQMLKDVGYTTAMFGKWHVGLTFLDGDGKVINENGLEAVKRIDYSQAISDGPLHRGFDQFFGTACCPTTDWLYAYIENDRIPIPPTKMLDRDPLPKHPYSHDNRRGLIAEGFDLEEVDVLFMEKSINFLKQHVKSKPDQPFFLFHSTQAVHLPSFPSDQFKGKTKSGPHGDFIFELDFIVGEIMNTLEQLGVSDNTLVIFSSDNGPEVPTVINMRKDHNHDGARPWRGMKRDQWEGGHRVPLIVSWLGKIKPGSVSSQMISLIDVMATCASIIGTDLTSSDAVDSYNMLPVLLGTQGGKPVRKFLLQQTISLELSIRNGQWKYLDHKGSGGNNYERKGLQQYFIADIDPEAPGQLYNLKSDPGETSNLYSMHPEIVEELSVQLEKFKLQGHSRPLSK